MIRNITTELLQALKTFFRSLPNYFRREFIWWTLLLPPLVAALVYGMSDANVFGWGRRGVVKGLMEIAHPTLLAAGLALALLFWRLTRDASLALLAAICGACLGRELGGQGTSVILMFGLFACIWYTDTHRPQLSTFLHATWPRSLVALCFISYAASQVLDRGILKHSVRLLSGDDQWKIRFSSNMEESLETFGGLCLVLAIAALIRVIRQQQGKLSHA